MVQHDAVRQGARVPLWKYYYEARNMLYLHLHVMHRVGWYPRNVTKLLARALLRERGRRLACLRTIALGLSRRRHGPARHALPRRAHGRAARPRRTVTVPGRHPGAGVVVLGMHRSGTSAVTRVMSLLGANLGPPDDLLTQVDNPAGHWESKALVACNDRILAAFGRSWDFPPWLAPGWEHSRRADALVDDMTATFDRVFTSGPWVWKDPRTCLTLPLWRRVLGPRPRVVLVGRDPGAVVTSIHRRDGIPRVYAAGLWQHYVRAAVRGATGMPVVCLRFEDLLRAPEDTIATLATGLGTLGVDLPGDPGAAAAALRAELVHDAEAPPVLRRLTARTAAVLDALPRVSAAFDPPPWREPAWVHPLLVAYRGPWVVRARTGHPLRTMTTPPRAKAGP